MTSPPNLQRAAAVLASTAPVAFAFLAEEGFDVADPRAADSGLRLVFESPIWRLEVGLRHRHAGPMLMTAASLGPRKGPLRPLDQLATDMPADIVPRPDRGEGPHVDDDSEVEPAIRLLADKVQREWLGFLRAGVGAFQRVDAQCAQRMRDQDQDRSDAEHVRLGREAFAQGDFATAAAELAQVHRPSKADAKRLSIARGRLRR